MAIAAYLAKNETKKPKIPTEKDLPSMTPAPDPKIQGKLDKTTTKLKKDVSIIFGGIRLLSMFKIFP